LQFKVSVNRSDYTEYIKYVQRSLSAQTYSPFWKNLVVWMVLGFICVMGVNLLNIRTNIHIPTAVFTLTLFLVLYAFYLTQYRKRMAPEEEGFVLGERTYFVDENGMKDIRPYHESATQWSGVVRIGETQNHVFLMLDKLAGHIIPTRTLSPAENEALRTFIRKRVANKAL
jgi:hypothetical protein